MIALVAVALLSGCPWDGGPGRKPWVASARREDLIGKAIGDKAWLGLSKGQLERVLQTEVFPDHMMIDFTYRRPDTDMFGARFDEALVIHRPLRSDDVWILFRDGKVAHVATVFVE